MAWMEEFIRENIEHRTPNTEHRTPNVKGNKGKRPTPKPETVRGCPMASARRPTPIERTRGKHRTSNAERNKGKRPTLNAQRPTLNGKNVILRSSLPFGCW